MEYDELDYYLISSTSEPNVPLVKNNDDYDVDGINFVYLNEYAHIDKPVYLALNPTVPPKPNLEVDYLQFPAAVFSQKIAAVLLPMNINGYQLVPAIIVDKKGNEHSNFRIENAYTCVKCFDDEKSVYAMDDFTNTWEDIEKTVLDKEALSETPLNERLIVMPQETMEFGALYHKSIVDAIMSVNPVNIRFTSVEDWYEGIPFENQEG